MQAAIPLRKIASISCSRYEPRCPPSLPSQNEKANSELRDLALLFKPLQSLKQADDERTTYHSHLGEINKAFLGKVWCSLFNKRQVRQVHPQIRNSWGVTAAKPRDTVLKCTHANRDSPPVFHGKQPCGFNPEE